MVNGTDYKFWRVNLADLTDQQLVAGLEGTKEFHGFLTWAEFRALCVDSTKQLLAYRQYLPPPDRVKLTSEQRKERSMAFRASLREATGI